MAQQQGDFLGIPGAVNLTPETKPAGPTPVGGLNVILAHRFGQLQDAIRAAGGDLTIFSGAREPHHQAELVHQAVGKHGSFQDAVKHVAPPGKSNHDPHAGLKHELGDGAVGVDVRGDIALAHKLAPQFGLAFPLPHVPWHLEVSGLKKGGK